MPRAAEPTASKLPLFLAAVALAAIVVASAAPARAESASVDAAVTSLPAPTQYVEDHAGIIDSASRTKLLGYLQELEEKTGCQVLVLTVKTTGGVPIEEYSLKVAEKWKLGRKGKDSGALILVAVDDGAYRFEIGSGLEGPLPDAFVGRIGRDYFIPYFRQGKYGEGLFRGVVAMLTKLEAEYGVELTGLPRLAPSGRTGGLPPWAVTFFVVIVATYLILSAVRGSLPFPLLLLLIFLGGGRRGGGSGGWSSGSGGGGFGGGGFGSFGGGGVGGFSGGGASGRW
jgi:uncharacterized protein